MSTCQVFLSACQNLLSTCHDFQSTCLDFLSTCHDFQSTCLDFLSTCRSSIWLTKIRCFHYFIACKNGRIYIIHDQMQEYHTWKCTNIDLLPFSQQLIFLTIVNKTTWQIDTNMSQMLTRQMNMLICWKITSIESLDIKTKINDSTKGWRDTDKPLFFSDFREKPTIPFAKSILCFRIHVLLEFRIRDSICLSMTFRGLSIIWCEHTYLIDRFISSEHITITYMYINTT